MNSKKHLRKIRHNYLLLLSTFRPPFPCRFFLFRPNGMFIARHLQHLLVTGFVKNTATTVINMIRITFTVFLFRVIVKEVILKVLLKFRVGGEDRNRIYSFPTKVISEAILLVYPLHRAPAKNVNIWLFRWNKPHYWRRYPVTISYPDYGS